jgi:ubiquinone/menaquinone biosynthesis C-methylase UbiE
VTRSPAATPGLWDALRGAGARRDLEELLDRPDTPRSILAANLAHLRLLNRWLLWSASVSHDVHSLLRRRSLRSAAVLDVATGSADIPAEIVRRGRAVGLDLRAVASDVSAAVLREARAQSGSSVLLVQHDGTALPFRDNSVDIGLCCLAAHHFAPDALTLLLSELWRVARHGVIISDLTRSRPGYLAARAMALVLRNRLTSHDGPVSVLRAYTPAELRALARTAGLTHVRVRTHFPARMTMLAEKEPGA